MPNYTQDANCQAAWLFTEGSGTTVDDSSPNANTGNFKGTGEPGWNATDVSFGVTGVAPNSVLFDSSDDYINCGTSDTILPYNGACTITAWIYPSAVDNTGHRIIDRSSVFLNITTTGSNIVQFMVNGSTQLQCMSAASVFTTGAWQHIAVTWDGSTTGSNARIYRNGVEVSYGTRQNGATLTSNAGATTYIGNRADGARCFEGYITECAVFNRVLNGAEIWNIYAYGLTGYDTTGKVLPTSATTSSIDPWLDEDWVNSAAILSMNGNLTANLTAECALITAASFDNDDQSYIIKASKFGLSIPAGYTIDGVICRIKAFALTSCSIDMIQLLDTSRVQAGDNKAATSIMLSTVTAIISVGGSADTWGNVLNESWVENDNFGVAIGAHALANNVDVFIDHVTLEVFYTAPVAALSLKYFFVEC